VKFLCRRPPCRRLCVEACRRRRVEEKFDAGERMFKPHLELICPRTATMRSNEVPTARTALQSCGKGGLAIVRRTCVGEIAATDVFVQEAGVPWSHLSRMEAEPNINKHGPLFCGTFEAPRAHHSQLVVGQLLQSATNLLPCCSVALGKPLCSSKGSGLERTRFLSDTGLLLDIIPRRAER
jgi:hypothetical protein